ncbi:MAG: hypothetical protein ACQEP8_06015 [Chlamydiota bacterium]
MTDIIGKLNNNYRPGKPENTPLKQTGSLRGLKINLKVKVTFIV